MSKFNHNDNPTVTNQAAYT